ncbi:MAG: hydrolase TatD [Crenarchaeota archaeon]|nr:hydrolase TatD [Thermoproteota archaeon]
MPRLLYADAHAHSNPVTGMGARRIARKFRSVGGWFMAIVSLPPWHYGLGGSLEDHLKAVDITIRECREAREEGLTVSCLAGFHPAEVDSLVSQGMQPGEVARLADKVIDYIAKKCREGLLDGIGEVGRPHYKTMPERVAVAEYVMLRAFEEARDNDLLIHLHLENAGEATVLTIDKLARITGVKPSQLVFHHASRRVAAEATLRGYWATLPGKERLLEAVLPGITGEGVMIESDFIDDPKRPCVSSCPWQVVEAEKKLLEKGVVGEELLYRLNVDNIVKAYHVQIP